MIEIDGQIEINIKNSWINSNYIFNSNTVEETVRNILSCSIQPIELCWNILEYCQPENEKMMPRRNQPWNYFGYKVLGKREGIWYANDISGDSDGELTELRGMYHLGLKKGIWFKNYECGKITTLHIHYDNFGRKISEKAIDAFHEQSYS